MTRAAMILMPALLLLSGASGLTEAPPSRATRPSFVEGSAAGPAIIYYGLNESHSRSWARINDEGVVGISYFQRSEGSDTDGTLIYKAVRLDGSEHSDSVATGARLEKSVLLYDASSNPHIFVARSNDSDQTVDHYQKNGSGSWQCDTIIHFYNEGGRFIYELSADAGPDHSFHLLLLKTRSDIDSDDFWDAHLGARLYYLTNVTGPWAKELIHTYDCAWAEDMYIKSSSRQDIALGEDGSVHVTFSEQVMGEETPSRLLYATKRTGEWVIETALSYVNGASDDAGWFPSLCLDSGGTPHISCMYVNRVPTLSAVYCKLFLLERLGLNSWRSEVIADRDDGYYGGDGRRYTGGLSHLVFDGDDTPHIVFSDIASTHWPGSQRLCVGNIRYGVYRNGAWSFTTLYRQPLPAGYFSATEMHGLCLAISEETGTIRIIGQELVVAGSLQYACGLVNIALDSKAPETPRSLAGVATADWLKLMWAPNAEGDLSHYSLYRSDSEDFTPGSENLILETPDTSALDSTWAHNDYRYKLSAVDAYGNESEFALLRPNEIVPALLRGFKAVVAERSIEISWVLSDARAREYCVLRAVDSGGGFCELASPEIHQEGCSYAFHDDSCGSGHAYRYRIDVLEGGDRWTLFDTEALTIPRRSFALYQSHPNPFNPITMISFEVAEKAHVNLSIYGLEGRLVKTLLSAWVGEGRGQATWDGTDARGKLVSSGVYFCRLRSGMDAITRKIVLLR